MSPRKTGASDPRIVELPACKMAVVRATGSPDKVFPQVFPALYGSVYSLKFGLKKKGAETFKVAPPRSRYPNAENAPKDSWTIITGVPVPDGTIELPQKVPGVKVLLETWEYGTTAEILHIGPYDQEQPTLARLHKFIFDSGYVIAGDHEEEYLTRPESKVVKTMIRYPVRKRS